MQLTQIYLKTKYIFRFRISVPGYKKTLKDQVCRTACTDFQSNQTLKDFKIPNTTIYRKCQRSPFRTRRNLFLGQRGGSATVSPRLLGLSVGSLRVLPCSGSAWVPPWYSGFHPESTGMNTRVTSNSILSIGVSAEGCVCVGPALNWQPVQGVSFLCTNAAVTGSVNPTSVTAGNALVEIDGWHFFLWIE